LIRKFARTVALAVCGLVVAPAAWAAARVPTHVACVGDSITAGYGASSTNASYPADLQGLFGSSVQVRNFGHSGATLLSTGDLPYQQQSEYTSATSFVSGAGASAVVDVVIMLGTNDTKPANWTSGGGTRATQFQTDCAALVDHFAQLSTHPQVFLALPPEIYANSYGIDAATLDNQIIPIIKQVAADKRVPIIDVNTPTKNHPELFSDGVHPTDQGYKLVAQIIHDGLLAATGGASGAGGGTAGAAGVGGGGTAGRAGAAGGAGGKAGAAGQPGSGGRGGPGSGGRAGAAGEQTGGSSGTGSGGAAVSGSGGSATGGITGGGQTGGATGTGGSGSGGSGSGGSGSKGTGGQGASPAASDSSGCSCSTTGGQPTAALWLLGLVWLGRRRRGR